MNAKTVMMYTLMVGLLMPIVLVTAGEVAPVDGEPTETPTFQSEEEIQEENDLESESPAPFVHIELSETAPGWIDIGSWPVSWPYSDDAFVTSLALDFGGDTFVDQDAVDYLATQHIELRLQCPGSLSGELVPGTPAFCVDEHGEPVVERRITLWKGDDFCISDDIGDLHLEVAFTPPGTNKSWPPIVSGPPGEIIIGVIETGMSTFECPAPSEDPAEF